MIMILHHRKDLIFIYTVFIEKVCKQNRFWSNYNMQTYTEATCGKGYLL